MKSKAKLLRDKNVLCDFKQQLAGVDPAARVHGAAGTKRTRRDSLALISHGGYRRSKYVLSSGDPSHTPLLATNHHPHPPLIPVNLNYR